MADCFFIKMCGFIKLLPILVSLCQLKIHRFLLIGEREGFPQVFDSVFIVAHEVADYTSHINNFVIRWIESCGSVKHLHCFVKLLVIGMKLYFIQKEFERIRVLLQANSARFHRHIPLTFEQIVFR